MEVARALTDFRRDGYCIVPALLPEAALSPVRELIDDYISARANSLASGGHISDPCPRAPFKSRWSRIREQVSDTSSNGPIGGTSNWGVSSPHGEVLLDERIHELYCAGELTTLASAILESEEVFGCGNFWIRPMTSSDAMGKYPLHQDSHFYGECACIHYPREGARLSPF